MNALHVVLSCIYTYALLHLILGMIDEPREGRDIGTEHDDGVWWTYPEEAKNQEYMLGPECLAHIQKRQRTRSTCLDRNTHQASII